MKNSKLSKTILTLLVSALIVLALSNESKAQPPNSAPSSPNSAIPVRTASGSDRIPEDSSRVVNACAAAAEELAVSRKLIDALERENHTLNERLAIARQTEALLTELSETRRAENEALREAVTAKNETIAAKDAALAKQDELIAELKRRKSSPWKRIGDILIGVAVSSILK